jgi:hypothetical protein
LFTSQLPIRINEAAGSFSSEAVAHSAGLSLCEASCDAAAFCVLLQAAPRQSHVAHASKSQKGRWAGMDAGNDASDDQASIYSSCMQQ